MIIIFMRKKKQIRQSDYKKLLFTITASVNNIFIYVKCYYTQNKVFRFNVNRMNVHMCIFAVKTEINIFGDNEKKIYIRD